MFRRISFDSVTDAVSVDLTSTVGDWAMTVTSSLTAAGFIWMVTASVAVVVTRIFSWTTVPKPWSSTLIWYSPGGRAGKRNSPLTSVTDVRTPMRFAPEIVTLTPGRGAFWSSVTTPPMAPVSRDCENARGARRNAMAKNAMNCFFNQTSLSSCLEDRTRGMSVVAFADRHLLQTRYLIANSVPDFASSYPFVMNRDSRTQKSFSVFILLNIIQENGEIQGLFPGLARRPGPICKGPVRVLS